MPRDRVFIGRQPILDRQERIQAYELLFRDSEEAVRAVIDDPLSASAQVIVDTFATLGAGSVLGGRLGFLNLTAEMLHHEAIEALPRDRVVLEILESVAPDADTVARCRQLRKRGYQLALDDFEWRDPREPLLEFVDYVKVDVLAVRDRDLPRLTRRLRRAHVRLVAEKVEDPEQHRRCRRLGFELFQGYYFARPTIVSGKPMDPARATVLRLLGQLGDDVDAEQISETFKQNVDLGLGLLRLVNSAALGPRQKLATVRDAVRYLGRRQLRRWLTLLLFAGADVGHASPLLQTAAVRGRLMELLVPETREAGGQRDLQDRAFLVGMLSLVDALLGVPRDVVLGDMNLEDAIRDAILEGKGLLGTLLGVAERLESLDLRGVRPLLEEQGVAAGTLRRAQLEAYAWVDGLAGSEEPAERGA